jgi:hypothetical protein
MTLLTALNWYFFLFEITKQIFLGGLNTYYYISFPGLMVCYHRIYTCAKPFTRSQYCVTIGSVYHCHISKGFPHFSDGRRSTTREASVVTSRDQIARLVEPTAPYLGHLKVRYKSRKGNKGNKVIVSHVQDNKQFEA